MPEQTLYVPILKGKEGEFAALEALDHGVKSKLTPMVEIPAVPYDYAQERLSKSLEDHVSGVPQRLKRSCGSFPFYLDMPWFDAAKPLSDGRSAMDAMLSECENLHAVALPVVSRSSQPAYLSAARDYMSRTRNAACIRLLVDDFEEEVELEYEVNRLVSELALADASKIDLLIDLKDLSTDAGRSSLITRLILKSIPREDEWRRIILAGASYPEDLSAVDAATTEFLPRREWDLWRALHRKSASLARQDLIFGDYAVSHPVPKELDPRTMRMSANIRYTTQDQWLIIKGRNVRQYGFSQYFGLCRELVEHPDYSGRGFSWGDTYISDCADAQAGPGNATTWRKVGANHHITLVAHELAKPHLGV